MHITTGRDIKVERTRAGLTQAQLANLLGVTARRIATVEASYTVSRTFADRVRQALSDIGGEAA